MEPVITAGDAAAVASYLDSGGWLTEYEQTRALERAIADYTGARFCTITPSGTLAIFLGLSASGVKPGDEVIVPALTMAASATAAILAGASVTFVDIEPGTLCLDLDAAEAAFTERTRAVVFVSLNGRAPASLSSFAARCRERGITLLEDAAQSLGSFVNGRHLGTLGKCGCLSFSSQKIITMGQGGAVITDDQQLYSRMLLLRDFGRRSGGSDHYIDVGWNLKFTDLQAVVGLSQMQRLPDLVARKREIFKQYQVRLADSPGVEIPSTDLTRTTPWFVDVLLAPGARDRVMQRLKTVQIGTRACYPPLHREPAFERKGQFPVAESLSARALWLPSSLKLRDADIERVCAALAEAITHP
jgi:perosamine synthetase